MPGFKMPSGGGGDPTGNVNLVPTKPAWYPNNMTIQNQPHQLADLASDMAAGGFGNQAADLTWLRNSFRPAQSVAYTNPEGYKKPAPKTNPVPGPKGGPTAGPTGGPFPAERGTVKPPVISPTRMRLPRYHGDLQGGLQWLMYPPPNKPNKR